MCRREKVNGVGGAFERVLDVCRDEGAYSSAFSSLVTVSQNDVLGQRVVLNG